MNMLRKKLTIGSSLAMLLFCCFLPLVGQAQPMGGPSGPGGPNSFGEHSGFGRRGGGPVGERMLERLSLSQDQRTQINKLRQVAQIQAKPLRQEMLQKRQELMQYISTSKANESQALSLQSAISERQAKLSQLRIKTWFQMRQLMTPEQLEQLSQLKQQGMQQRQRPGGRFRDQANLPGLSQNRERFTPENEHEGL